MCSPNHVNEAVTEVLQEENVDTLCNEAFDELFIQEFNPDGKDFSNDNQFEADNTGNVEELDKIHQLSRLRSGNPEGIFSSRLQQHFFIDCLYSCLLFI